MKVIFSVILSNILAVVVGLVVLFACDTILAPIFYLIAQIPIVGSVIFFLGTSPVQIIANYSMWSGAALTLMSASAVALPNRKGHKPGMAVLAVLLMPLYFLQGRGIFITYGFSFDLLMYIAGAVGAVVFAFAIAFSKEDYVEDEKTTTSVYDME